MRFAAIDVETPNGEGIRMSAIGVTVVEDGAVTDEFYTLVDPETYFERFNTLLTGIDEEAVRGAPTFAEAWERIRPMLDGAVLAAHNATFDLGVLKNCLRAYCLDWEECVAYVCTARMGRRLLPGMRHRLNDLCDLYGIPLDHHHAGSDSRACAEILLRFIEAGADVRQFIRTYRLF